MGFHTHRIHGAAIFNEISGEIFRAHVGINIPAPWFAYGIVMGVPQTRWIVHMLGNIYL